jgi:hypothetical protein
MQSYQDGVSEMPPSGPAMPLMLIGTLLWIKPERD